MADLVERVQAWLAAAAIVAIGPGLIWAPGATWAALTVCGLAMLFRLSVAAARGVGARSTAVRLAIGASAGPWTALVNRDMATGAALEVSLVFALFAVASASFWPSLRRADPGVFRGIPDGPRRSG